MAAGQAGEAEALWRLHLQEAENYLLMNATGQVAVSISGERPGVPWQAA